jgi:hypothetical protein
MLLTPKTTMFRRIGFLFLLTIVAGRVGAQEVRKRGLVVVNSGDTVRGWIGLLPWNSSPVQIDFWKDSLSVTPVRYGLQDLAYFEVTSYDTYARAILPPNTFRGLSGDAAPGIQDTTTPDSAFLRLLIGGNRLSLWEYSHGSDLFFISEAKDSFQLLLNEQPEGDGAMPRFKLQLAVYIQRYGLADALERPLLLAGYEEHDLSNLIKAIDQQAGQVYSAPAIKGQVFSWFLGAGGGITTLVAGGDMSELGKLSFPYRFVPLVDIGVDWASLKDMQKLVLRAQLDLSRAVYDGRGVNPTTSLDQEQYHIEQWNISPSISLLYHFTARETGRFYLGGEVTCNYSFYSANYLYSSFPGQKVNNYFPATRLWMAASARAGLRLNARWEVAASALLFGPFTQSNNYSLTPHGFLACLQYHIK